jgi:hypothetical protein
MTTLRGICLRANIDADLRQFERSKMAWCLKSADKAGMLREGILRELALARREAREAEDPVEDPDAAPEPPRRYDEWTPTPSPRSFAFDRPNYDGPDHVSPTPEPEAAVEGDSQFDPLNPFGHSQVNPLNPFGSCL